MQTTTRRGYRLCFASTAAGARASPFADKPLSSSLAGGNRRICEIFFPSWHPRRPQEEVACQVGIESWCLTSALRRTSHRGPGLSRAPPAPSRASRLPSRSPAALHLGRSARARNSHAPPLVGYDQRRCWRLMPPHATNPRRRCRALRRCLAKPTRCAPKPRPPPRLSPAFAGRRPEPYNA